MSAATATTVPATAIPGKPLAADARRQVIDDFHRDGFALLPGVLADEAPRLRALIDRVFDDPAYAGNRYGDWIAARLFETDPVLRDLLVAEPWITLAEEVLGPDCHLVAQNTVRNRPGEAITGWHVDDELFFPLPEGVERHDPRVRLPKFLFTIQILLSDVPDEAHGPTQFVPGSHYAGRQPSGETPTFAGRGPVSILGRAGDAYLHDPQCWHRGAPNTSTATRYLLQIAYGRRWIAQRFHPFIDYRMPEHVWDGAGERLQRVLGRHPKGPYG